MPIFEARAQKDTRPHRVLLRLCQGAPEQREVPRHVEKVCAIARYRPSYNVPGRIEIEYAPPPWPDSDPDRQEESVAMRSACARAWLPLCGSPPRLPATTGQDALLATDDELQGTNSRSAEPHRPEHSPPMFLPRRIRFAAL